MTHYHLEPMANRPHMYADFTVGHVFPHCRYRIESSGNDAFTSTFKHAPVRDASGAVVLDPAHRPAVRALHPTLVANFQPQHAAFAWPAGVLHAREKVSLSGSIHPGEQIETVVTVKDKYIKSDKRFVVLELAIRKQETGQIAMIVERTLLWPK